MTSPEEPSKKSRFDLSQYSDKTRKIIFGVIVAFLVLVVIAVIIFINPGNQNTGAKPQSTNTSTQAPVNSDTSTPTPTPNPTSAEQQAQERQQQIIDDGKAAAEKAQKEQVQENDQPVPNGDALLQIVKNGVMAYCVINPGETTADRKAKMQPYFHADSSTYTNPADFYYQRNCNIEAASNPTYGTDGKTISVYISVSWTGVLSASDKTAQAGITQYQATVDENGIISLND